jgi:serine/threonine-protein kinase
MNRPSDLDGATTLLGSGQLADSPDTSEEISTESALSTPSGDLSVTDGKGAEETVGKYEIRRSIAEGGFATVYEGWDPFIERRVAIKRCSAADPEARHRFQREARIAGNMDHPNVVRIFDSGIDNGRPYLIQEFLSGTDLDAVISSGQYVSFPEKLLILLQTARGLAYAHSHGVIHRDIKPANVRILEDGSVKLMDFGIAMLKDRSSRLTRDGMTAGTVAYLAPEQIKGEPASPRSDVFSFGVLAYELLSSSRPFDGETISAILYQIVNARPPALAELRTEAPVELAQLVHRCLEKEPSCRWADGVTLHKELERLRDEISTCARSSSASRPSQRQLEVRSVTESLDEVQFNVTPVPRDPSGRVQLAAAPRRRRARWPWAVLPLLVIALLVLWRSEIGGDLRSQNPISEQRSGAPPDALSGEATSEESEGASSRDTLLSTSGFDDPEPSRDIRIEQIDSPTTIPTSELPDSAGGTPSAPPPVTAGLSFSGIWNQHLRVAIDDGPSRRLRAIGRTELSAGEHLLMFSLDTGSYRAKRRLSIHLEAGKDRQVKCPLLPPGALTIQAALGSRQGTVRIDGEIVGKTPVRRHYLAPGEHDVSILLTSPAPIRTLTTQATLRSDEETIVTFDSGQADGVRVRYRTLESADGRSTS